MSEHPAWDRESEWFEEGSPSPSPRQLDLHFNQRMQRIELQISRLVAHMESERRTREQQTSDIRTDIRALKETLASSQGDGGLYARIIMMESRWAAWSKWLWLVGGGVVALLFNLFKDFLAK